jgi:predicted alpha/beta-fold hydrolase
MQAASSLYQFDDAVTAPLHGFDDADDYWRRASAKPLLWLPQRLLGFFDQQEVR